MGKIKKTAAAKHEITLSQGIADSIKLCTAIPLHQLVPHLAKFPSTWPFPRGDLYHWINVLNRFDGILDAFNTEYGLKDGPQMKQFSQTLLLQGDAYGGETVGGSGATVDILRESGYTLDGDRVLIETIVSFSKLLMENCGNRSLYASSNQLSNLLNTTSLSLLEITLQLGLRLAQRYSSSRLRMGGPHIGPISHGILATHYVFDLAKIEKIALPFTENNTKVRSPGSPTLKSKDKSQAALSSSKPSLSAFLKDSEGRETGSQAYGRPWIQYYNADQEPGSEPISDLSFLSPTTPAPVTPTPVRYATGLGTGQTPRPGLSSGAAVTPRASNVTVLADVPHRPGFKIYELSPEDALSSDINDIVAKNVTNLPREAQYDLLHKIRVAKALSGPESSRLSIVAIRLLAIANIAHIHPENSLQQKVFQHEIEEPRRSQISYQLCELIHPVGQDVSVTKHLQTIALFALEALANHKYKGIDIAAALGINVNHGVLAYVLRKAVSELDTESSSEADFLIDSEWRESLFSLLHVLPKSSHRASESLVSAGLLDVLCQSLTYRTDKAELDHPRVLNFLDVFVYNTRDAFQALIDAKGLDITSNLLTHEVEKALTLARNGQGLPRQYKTQVTDYQIPFPQQQTLRTLFKFIHHMMSINGGPFDRLLRNLIESSELLGGLRTVIMNPQTYGSNVWSSGVDIFSSFIHNEPTSYTAIAESGLTRAFLETITQEPVPDPVASSTAEAATEPMADVAHPNVRRPPIVPVTDLGADPKTVKPAPVTQLHNEVTSAGGWRAWTKAYTKGVLPITESIAILPHAFGAICLAEAGTRQFQASNAISKFFRVFICPLHVRAMANSQTTDIESIGEAFDELARHHPWLKALIIEAMWHTTLIMFNLCHTRAGKHGAGAKLLVRTSEARGQGDTLPSPTEASVPTATNTAALTEQEPTETLMTGKVAADVEMSDAPVSTSAEAPASISSTGEAAAAAASDGASTNAEDSSAYIEMVQPGYAADNGSALVMPAVSDYIGVFSRFLLGFFSNTTMCTAFAETPGLEMVLNLASLPSLPHDFSNSPSYQKLARVIQIFAQEKPHLTLPSILKRSQIVLGRLGTFMDHPADSSYFAKFVTPLEGGQIPTNVSPGVVDGTKTIKALVAIQTLCMLLTKAFTQPNHRTMSQTHPFAQVNLADIYSALMEQLSKLQLRCAAEAMLLPPMPENLRTGALSAAIDQSIPSGMRDDASVLPRDEAGGAAFDTAANPTLEPAASVPVDAGQQISDRQKAARFWHEASHEQKNYVVIRTVLAHIPTWVSQLVSTLGKAILTKRVAPDSFQKQNALLVADQLAKTLVEQLRLPFVKVSDPKVIDYHRSARVGFVSGALIDRKSTGDRQGVHLAVLVLRSFKNQGGIALLGSYAEAFQERIASLSIGVDSGSQAVERNYAADGLQRILKLFSQLTNHRIILEAPQAQALANRSDRSIDKLDPFTPGQFVVELRLEIMRVIMPIWKSDALGQDRESVTKDLVSILNNVLEGSGETGGYKRADKITLPARPPRKSWNWGREDLVERLLEKGFEQDLAQEALYRCNDNAFHAAEYCAYYQRHIELPRHEVPAADRPTSSETSEDVPMTSPPQTASSATSAQTQGQTLPGLTELFGEDGVLRNNSSSQTIVRELASAGFPQSMLQNPAEPSSTEGPTRIPGMLVMTVDDLDEQRAMIRNDLMDRCLTVLNAYDGITFELSDLILAATVKASDAPDLRKDVVGTLVQSLISLEGPEGCAENSKQVSACAHLLGIVLQAREFFAAGIDTLRESLPTLLSFLKVPNSQASDESGKHIRHILLIFERALSEDAQPEVIRWSAPPSDNPEADMTVATLEEKIISSESRTALFDCVLDLLPKVGRNAELGLAIVRTMVSLTRDRQLALKLANKRNLQKMFVMVRQLSRELDDRIHTACMLILRHVIEDETTIRQLMRSEIHAVFEKPPRPVDTTVYTRSLYYLVLREPSIFVEVTNELLEISRFDRAQAPQILTLKKGVPSPPEDAAHASDPSETVMTDVGEAQEFSGNKEKAKSVETKAPTVENPDGVIHYLLSQLLSYKDVEDKPTVSLETASLEPGQDTGTTATIPTGSSATQEWKKSDTGLNAEDHPIFVYRSFIMQCLVELLQSYNRTKIEFINFSRKADPQAPTPAKPRSGILNYILHALVPPGSLQHPADVQARKRSHVANLAISVVVSLCSRTSEKGAIKRRNASDIEDEPELLFVRRFVLEHALKAYKDANSSLEGLDSKYARLLGLADLFNRILAGKPSDNMYKRNHEPRDENLVPSQKQLAKIMFEKNFISALTNSVSDIDLNFPGANRVIKYILRPIKLLTHTAIELSLSSDLSSSAGQTDDDEISSATSVSDAAEDREETPDLFRNSTLGMFEPGRNEESSEGSEEDDEEEEDMYGDPYADDMDYDDDDHIHNDDVVSEDEGMEGIGPIEGLPGDMGMDVEIELNDHGQDSSDDDHSDSDDEDDDEDDDVEIMEEITGDEDEGMSGGGGEADWLDEDDEDEEIVFDEDGAHAIPEHVSFSGSETEEQRYNAEMVALGEGDMAIDDGEEDDEPTEEEDEGEEEDPDEEELVYGDGDMDEDDPFSWGTVPPTRHGHGHGHGHHHRHNHGGWPSLQRGLDRFGSGYRNQRPGNGSRPADDGLNPLLNRGQGDANSRLLSQTTLEFPALPNLVDLTRDQNPISYISNLINVLGYGGPNMPIIHHHHHGGALTFSVGPFPGGGPARLDLGRATFEIGQPVVPAAQRTRDDPMQAMTLTPMSTMERWQDEARLLYGSGYTEKVQRVINSILRVLVPRAIQAEQAKRQKEAELEEKMKLEREEVQRVVEATAKRLAEADEAGENSGDHEDAAAEVMEDVVEGDPSAHPIETEQAGQPTGSTARVIADIRGRQIDITNLGIDVAYLDALPDEMREEVIMQQFLEQRSQADAAGEPPTELNHEFLDALPAEIREELLAQEASDRRRRERETARRRSAAQGGATAAAAARAEEMDAASFLASLDPMLRQTVLAESDDAILSSLPPAFAAEARALGGRHHGVLVDYQNSRRLLEQRQAASGHIPAVDDKPSRRAIVQMLDKAGIATLLRLMFMPVNSSSRQALYGILRNVCGNRQTRGEVVSGLLSILQDGSADVGAVERSFAHLTLRAKQTAAPPKTPQSAKRNQPGPVINGADASPLMVVGQCLGALVYLTESIAHIPNFFLSEHETAGGHKPKFKGKGKGKESKAHKYPLNALLSLLDRNLVVNNSPAMEQLAGLLQSITQPLGLLLKKERDQVAATTSEPAEIPAAVEPTIAAEQSSEQALVDTIMGHPEASGAVEGSVASAEGTSSGAIADFKLEDSRKPKTMTPPEIPEENLRLIVNVLTARDCSGKTFRDTLSTINNLSAIPQARDTFGQELIQRARELGVTIHSDLRQLISALANAKSETEAQSLALANFSPTGSEQAKFNRVLTALDYIFDVKEPKEAAGASNVSTDGDHLLGNLYEDASFIALWQRLSDCLSATQQSDEKYFFNVATILLPLIEALMVVCKRLTFKEGRHGIPRKVDQLQSSRSESAMHSIFLSFTNKHKKILNDLVRHNPKLMSGSFSVLVKNPGILEFDNKRNYFNRRLHHRTADMRQYPHPTLQLNVRRNEVFLDSYKALYFKSGEEIKYGKFNIRFANEEGVDAGGVTREWFQVLARQMFNPDYALFNPVASDRTTFHPNPLSSINQEHLDFFKFIGRIIGKALCENRVLDCHFSRAVYKSILGMAASMKDMETIDLDYTKSMEWILENDITDVITEDFSIVVDNFGEPLVHDLKPDGRNIPVTEENKHEYVRLIIEHRLTGSVQQQLESFLKGFHDIVPAELISIFDEGELELLISGMPDVDVDDWKNNTEYHNYTAASPQIQWLWRAIRSFDKEERAKLLQFVTGTGKVPLNGFKELEGMNGYTRFSVHKDYGNKDRLPSSHTCFNQLDLPEYDNYEALRKALYTAMTTGNEYFGFA